MLHRHKANESHFEISPEIRSPHRPPQFNDTNNGCGCRCGMGGVTDGDDGDGGRSDVNNISTMVGPSDHSDSGDSFPPSSDGPEQHVAMNTFEGSLLEDERRRGEVRTKFSVFENGEDGFQLMQHMVAMEEWPPRWRRVQVIADDIADSMKNEPHGSDDHSDATPDNRKVDRMSPGPGMGMWAVENIQSNKFLSYADDFHPFENHHFLVSPLRLTPQRRY